MPSEPGEYKARVSLLSRVDRGAAAIIALHFLLAETLSFVMLLGYAPDEPRHFAYIRWIAHNWSIPPGDESLSGGAHSLHPPLYYILMLPAYLLFQGFGDEAAMRAMRCIAPLFGVAALWLLVPVLKTLTQGSRGLFLFILALIAVWPNFVLCTAMVNNDAASVLMAALLLNVVLVQRWEAKPSTGLIWGLTLGLAALAKFSNFIAGAGVVAVALIMAHGRTWYRREDFWRAAFLAGVGCIAVCGAWWVRNLLTFGVLNPYPLVPILPEGLTPLDAIVTGHAWFWFFRAVNGLWATTWPIIDWAPDVLIGPITWYLRLMTAAGLLGLVIWLVRSRKQQLTTQQWAAVLSPAAGYVMMLAALLFVATFKHMGTYRNGRYLMPFLPGLAIPLALGLHTVAPRRFRPILGVVVIALFVALNVMAFYHIITYHNPRALGLG